MFIAELVWSPNAGTADHCFKCKAEHVSTSTPGCIGRQAKNLPPCGEPASCRGSVTFLIAARLDEAGVLENLPERLTVLGAVRFLFRPQQHMTRSQYCGGWDCSSARSLHVAGSNQQHGQAYPKSDKKTVRTDNLQSSFASLHLKLRGV